MKPIQYIPATAVDRLVQGDAEILFAAFNHGLTPEVVWPNWQYPLLHGLAHSCPPRVDEMVTATLAAGGNAEQAYNGLTPLMLAIGAWRPEHDSMAQARRLGCVKQLLQASMDIDSGLMIAAASINFEEAVKVLIDAGVDVNAAGPQGRTALHEAYEERNAAISALLLKAGADPDRLDNQDKTPKMLLGNPDHMTNEQRAAVEYFDLDVKTRMAGPTKAASGPAPRL
jgi:hypothetical protein